MTPSAIAPARLRSQQISQTTLTSVQGVVEWMGAMQAQDFAMAKWAIGVRLRRCTEQMVDEALADGAIIRTHLLRPTWHFVARDDLRWMLELTGPRIKAAQRSRLRELGLTAEVVGKSHRIIARTLGDGNHCSREKIISNLGEAGIRTDENRASHLLLAAELDGIICSGPTARGKPTYALLDERVPAAKRMGRDEALAALARRYFTSRCPATARDFAWWSGLTAGDAARALKVLEKELRSETLDSLTYWIPASFSPPGKGAARGYLLPAYDEYTISYRGRSAALPASKTSAAISSNGIFYPLVVLDGQAMGTWRRIRVADRVVVQPRLFAPPDERLTALLQRACRPYARFLGHALEVDLGSR